MGLRAYILKRAINTVILVLFVIVINFLIFELIPGTSGAIANLVGTGKIQNPATVNKLLILDGFCKGFDTSGHCIPTSVWDQFTAYFQNMLTFQFGVSYQPPNQPILNEMISSGRLVNTLLLLGVSTALSLVIGIFLGVYAAAKRGSIFDSGWVTASLVTFSLPTFFMGLLFILVFTQILHWFPPGQVVPSSWTISQPPLLDQIVPRLQHLFLPVMTLTLFFYGGHLLLTRATMLESLSEDYIVTARAKGLSERAVLFKHALKNASLPIVTNAALSFGFILSGAIITETIFNWKGLGLWLFNSINAKDYPVMQAMFYIIALCVILANFIADVIYGILDPRIKYQ